MQSNTEQILLQGQDSVLHILRDILQNDLLFIELIRSGQSRPEALAAVAQNVRSGLYALDGLGDDVRELLESNLNH
jgi:hypothetical protein